MKVTIEAYNTADIWRFTGPVKLRIYARQSFWSSDGQFIAQGTPGQSNTAYLEIDGEVIANVLTLPGFEIDSTVDSLDNPWTTYDAELTAGSKRIPFLNSFAVNTLPEEQESYTWAELILHKNLIQPQSISESLSRQIIGLVATAAGALNRASSTNRGITALDVDPVDPDWPEAVGTNSPLLQQQNSPVFVNALDNSVANDAVVAEDASIDAASNILNSPTSDFNDSVIGKIVAVAGAGPGGATLLTEVIGVPSSVSLQLLANASTTVANTRAVYGTDNATAMQDLLDSIAGIANTATVYLPKGNYLFALGSLVVPQGVQIQGSWDHAPDHMGYRYANEIRPMNGEGTTLVVAADEGVDDGAFIFLNSGAALTGVCIFQPAQVASLAAPKLYPWAVEMFGAGCHVKNVELLNTYQGIYSHVGQRQTVRNVRGTPLLTGLYASQQLETSRYADITFVPIYTFSTTELAPFPHTPLMDWVSRNGTAFKMGRVDNAVFYNCFTFDYLKGFKFVVDAPEVTTFANGTGAPGGKAWAQFVSCGADTCSYPVDIDDVAGGANNEVIGVTFSDSVFAASQWAAFAGPELYAVWGRATMTGRLGLVNCRFHLAQSNIVLEGGRLDVSNCYFQSWTVRAVTLGPNGASSFTGNHFKLGNPLPIVLSTGSPWTAWSGNAFEAVEASVWSISATTNFSEAGNVYSDSPAWVSPALQNAWVDFDAINFQTVQYKRQDGRVHLRGTAKDGVVAIGTAVFTLPVGFRPPKNLIFPVSLNGTFGIVSIASSGVVSLQGGTNISASFDGIDFAVR